MRVTKFFHQDDRSEASIKAALEKSCQLCPDVQGCTAFIDQNLDELFKILKEDVTADTICEALKLCGAQAPPARIAQDPVCEECEKIASVIVAHINVSLNVEFEIFRIFLVGSLKTSTKVPRCSSPFQGF